MTHYSSPVESAVTEKALADLEDRSYLSRRDGCRVVVVTCEECDQLLEEEIKEAKRKIIADLSTLCLRCDPEAVALSFTGVTIKIGWFLG